MQRRASKHFYAVPGIHAVSQETAVCKAIECADRVDRMWSTIVDTTLGRSHSLSEMQHSTIVSLAFADDWV